MQHILASTCAGKCSVWDLRKNKSILKISDSTSKVRTFKSIIYLSEHVSAEGQKMVYEPIPVNLFFFIDLLDLIYRFVCLT